jgi:hypothetical protein
MADGSAIPDSLPVVHSEELTLGAFTFRFDADGDDPGEGDVTVRCSVMTAVLGGVTLEEWRSMTDAVMRPKR